MFQSQYLVNERALLIGGTQQGPRVIIQYRDIAFNRFGDESSLGHASQLDVSQVGHLERGCSPRHYGTGSASENEEGARCH